MASGTVTHIETFHVEHCCNCGIAFAVTQDFLNQRLSDRQNFYCPSGHAQHFIGKSDAQKAREAQAAAQQAQQAAERLRLQLKRREEDLQTERRSHSATKGQLTKTRKRASHAMCPVDGCKRSFANVARHIANQHPGYKTT